jgi:hypothetical protein
VQGWASLGVNFVAERTCADGQIGPLYWRISFASWTAASAAYWEASAPRRDTVVGSLIARASRRHRSASALSSADINIRFIPIAANRPISIEILLRLR